MRSQPTPGVISHSSFGTVMSGRTWSAESGYRYGFNGKDGDDEFSVDEGSYDFGARLYDSRLGRWSSIDQLAREYPSLSGYNAFGNGPILNKDSDGKEIIPTPEFQKHQLYGVFTQLMQNSSAYMEILKSFQGKEMDYTLNSTDELQKGVHALTGGAGLIDGIQQIRSDFGITRNEDLQIGGDKFQLSNSGMVLILVHEAIHAKYTTNKIKNSEGRNLSWGFGHGGDVWNNGILEIKSTLLEYSEDNKLNWSDSFIDDLSVYGSQGQGLIADTPDEGKFKEHIMQLAGINDTSSDEEISKYSEARTGYFDRVNRVLYEKKSAEFGPVKEPAGPVNSPKQ